MHAQRRIGRRRGSPPRAKLFFCLDHRTPPCPDARSVREYRRIWQHHPTAGLHISIWNGDCVGTASIIQIIHVSACATSAHSRSRCGDTAQVLR